MAAAEVRAQMQWLSAELGGLQPDDRLFPLCNEQSLYNYWKFYQRITPPISLYELRHTFVSMVADSLSPAQLRRMVGHSKSMDTLGWYSHGVAGQDVATAVAVTDALEVYLPPEK